VRLSGWVGKGKYRSIAGSGIHAYLMPGIRWPNTSRNEKAPVLLTEGEGKAAKANFSPDFPSTIGLTGVDCLYNSDGNIAYELAGWHWRGRTVYIAFDAPLHDDLLASLTRSAIRMIGLGAEVMVLTIDKTPTYMAATPGSKMGLDDYINAGGTWQELLDTAEDANTLDGTFNKLLTEIAIVAGSSSADFLHVSGRFSGIVRSKAAMEAICAPEVVQIHDKTVQAFPVWLKTRQRIVLDGIVVRPDLPPLSITPDRNWNSFRGIATIPKRDKKMARKFYHFLRLFFAGSGMKLSPEARLHRRKFLQWSAHLFQHPELPRPSSFTFPGAEGVGKSTLLEILAYIIGLKNGALILGAADLESTWTGFLDGAWFVVFNEPSTKALATSSKLKELRTNPFVSVNHKYGACYKVPNVLTFGFTTNADFAFAISEDARRDWVWSPEWSQNDRCGGESWSEACSRIAGLMKDSEAFRAAVLWELMYGVDLTDYDPYAPAGDSKAKRVAALASRSEVAEEEAAAWNFVKQYLDEDGLFMVRSSSLPEILRSMGIGLRVSRFQHVIRTKSMKEGWHCGSATDKLAGRDGKPARVWYVATRLHSELSVESRQSAMEKTWF
jgi:energy-coupling factor transporter ATP-binding protein EcfA2